MVVSIAELAGRVFESRHTWELCVRHAIFVGLSVRHAACYTPSWDMAAPIVELTAMEKCRGAYLHHGAYLHRGAYGHRGDMVASFMELTVIVERTAMDT